MFHERGAYYPARHTARQSRNQKAGKHIRAGITPEDNVFARRATNLTISSTENLGPRNMTVSCCLLHRAYAADPLCDFSKCLPFVHLRVDELMQLDDST